MSDLQVCQCSVVRLRGVLEGGTPQFADRPYKAATSSRKSSKISKRCVPRRGRAAAARRIGRAGRRTLLRGPATALAALRRPGCTRHTATKSAPPAVGGWGRNVCPVTRATSLRMRPSATRPLKCPLRRGDPDAVMPIGLPEVERLVMHVVRLCYPM